MTIYKLAFACLISAGFIVPSWGMDDEDKKDNSTLIIQLACPYVREKEQKKFLQLNKSHRKYFQDTTFYLKISMPDSSHEFQELLEGFSYLKKLDLSRCKLTGEGMQSIYQLQNLTDLDLSWCEFTNKEMQNISHLKNLIYLNLTCCELTDKEVQHISQLENLIDLNLSWCRLITDEGMQYIFQLKNLTHLNLSFCSQITDEVQNMPQFKDLPWLMIKR